MSHDSLDDLIKAMLEASQKTKLDAEQKLQEQKAREEEQLKLAQAIKYQKEHLVNLLNVVVEKFNQQSAPGEKIIVTPQDVTEGSTIYQTVVYTLPNKSKSIALVFSHLEPALNLVHGLVPLGAYLKGYRSKFLWCRTNHNDRLGKWLACEPLLSDVDSNDVTNYEEEHRFNEKILRSLEVPSVNGIATANYREDVRKEFAQVLLQAMRS